ncbi:MAG: KTSC domain-containing protein [Planctomycetes bacterium]|nr:KTSC domain-containing protein [Planctomycetota bacterium]
MERTAVDSSNLANVGYDATKRVLVVEFNNGRVYEYRNVPVRVYSGLMRAGSKGGYLHKEVVKKYRGREVHDDG